MPPYPFSTALGNLTGPVNGQNNLFSFTPFPFRLQYSVPQASGTLLFRNGLLQDIPGDYTEGAGYFTFPSLPAPDTITARVYQGGGATRLHLNRGLAVIGTQTLWISLQPGISLAPPFMLFRNGQLLTNGDDYTISAPWIELLTAQQIQPGDNFIALIGTGGVPCSTTPISFIPLPNNNVMLFRNGQFLNVGVDYYFAPTGAVVIGAQAPLPGDLFAIKSFPISVGMYAAGVTGAQDGMNRVFTLADPLTEMIFLNGVLQSLGLDYTLAGTVLTFTAAPGPTDIISAETFEYAASTQCSTWNGSIAGALDGANKRFACAGSGAMMLFRNGLLQYPGVDYVPGAILPTIFNMIAAPVPGDVLTAQVFSSVAPQPFIASFGYSQFPITGTINGVSPTFTLPGFLNNQWETQDAVPVVVIHGAAGLPGFAFPGSTIPGFSISTIAPAFTLQAPSQVMLFRNGQLLTQGIDYTQSAATVTLIGAQIPQPGDTLTAQIWAGGGPTQVSNVDGSLYYASAVEVFLFISGLLETQPAQGIATGDMARYGQAPVTGSVPTVEAWVPDVTLMEPAFNLPVQFSTLDGSLQVTGNAIFTLSTGALVTGVMVFKNGGDLEYGVDFVWSCMQLSSAGPWVTTVTFLLAAPLPSDVVTVEASLS